MSDEDRDVDIESDEEDDQDQDDQDSSQPPIDKRAHHNALERKRRDHIKDSFHNLRDSVPTVHGEKVSRAQILKKAADYIVQLREKNSNFLKDIDTMKKHNQGIQNQIKHLEKCGDAAMASRRQAKLGGAGPVSESSEEDDGVGQPSRKKLKTAVDSS